MLTLRYFLFEFGHSTQNSNYFCLNFDRQKCIWSICSVVQKSRYSEITWNLKYFFAHHCQIVTTKIMFAEIVILTEVLYKLWLSRKSFAKILTYAIYFFFLKIWLSIFVFIFWQLNNFWFQFLIQINCDCHNSFYSDCVRKNSFCWNLNNQMIFTEIWTFIIFSYKLLLSQ